MAIGTYSYKYKVHAIPPCINLGHYYPSFVTVLLKVGVLSPFTLPSYMYILAAYKLGYTDLLLLDHHAFRLQDTTQPH